MTDPDPLDVARDLMRRLDEIDKLFDRQEQERDYSEKLGAAALEAAEVARISVSSVTKLTRRIVVVMLVGLLAWSPALAYGAIYLHETVRNRCYPAVALTEQNPPQLTDEPWFCGIFPGTGRPMQH